MTRPDDWLSPTGSMPAWSFPTSSSSCLVVLEQDFEVLAFIDAYRDAGGDAPAADSLALTVEAIDVD